ncbi:hypothetical protein PLICRDRAFT_31052 [Plicaturopsis crispa FD-325 SS-3]|nr:hypothetical protein PLICRDRAFT_31052 [Plicaturopsis crispa FD-325 SS-3]
MFSVVGFTLAALTASSLAVPVDNSVQCTQIGQANLKLFPTPAAENPSIPGTGLLLGLDPVRDAQLHPALQAYNGVDEPFDYFSCQSTFMNLTTYSPGTDHAVHYGHIRSSTNSSNCLGLQDVAGGIILALPCSYADDESQLKQFWTFAQNKTDPLPSVARFTGHTYATAQENGWWSTNTGYWGGNQVISAKKVDASPGEYNSPYQLTFVAPE